MAHQTVTGEPPRLRATLQLAADHPAAPGHFPGNPVIPGAVLLNEIATVICNDGTTCGEIVSAKFLQVVRPGDRLDVEWRTRGPWEFDFVCFAEATGVKVLIGMLRMRST
jgi:3-hydroxyacyl-[acyl-carrier-protein] dehydratase